MGRLDGLNVPALVQILEEEGFSRKWEEAVVRAAQKAPARDLVPLAELLRSPDWGLRHNIATVMARIPNSHATKLLVESALENEDEEIVKVAVGALMHMREEAVGLLAEVMESNAGIVRLRAALILAEIGNALGISILVAAVERTLEESDDDMLPRMLEALGRLGDARAIPPLIKVLEGEHSLLRLAAAGSLVAIGEPAVEALLDVVWNSGDADARSRAVETLGQIGSKSIGPPLMRLLQEDDLEVTIKYEIVEALGKIGDPDLIETVIQAMTTGDPVMRFRASRALVRMGRGAVEGLACLLRESANEDVRRSSAEALVQIADSRAVPTLIAALRDDNNLVRKAATEALGKLKDRRAVEALCEALEADTWFVAGGAADALAQIGDEKAIGPLLKALGDDRREVRRRAIRALQSFGPIESTFMVGLTAGDERIRVSTAQALAESGESDAVEALFQAASQPDPAVRRTATRALARMARRDVQQWLRRIVSEEGPGSKEILAALRDVGEG
jgi:HEAT repeat protein